MRPGPKGRNPERTPSADARSALRATAARGRSAPRPRLESASRTRPCGPDSLQGWPAAKSLRPQRRLRLAFGQSRRRPATDQWAGVQQPASRRAAGAMPLPASPRYRTGSAFWEARPLLRGAQHPRGGGKLRGFAAHARRARERPERALFSAECPWRAIRLRSLGAQGVCQLRPLPATDPAIGQPMRVRLTGGGSATLPRVPPPGKFAAPLFPSLGAPAT